MSREGIEKAVKFPGHIPARMIPPVKNLRTKVLFHYAALAVLLSAHAHAKNNEASWSVQIDTSALQGSRRDFSSSLPVTLIIHNRSNKAARWATSIVNFRVGLNGNSVPDAVERKPIPTDKYIIGVVLDLLV